MKPWKVILFTLLILISMSLLSACQAIQPLTRGIENTLQAFSNIPDRLAQGVANLVGSIGNVGDALAGSIRNIIQNMTER